jgi:hypothetical protein
MFLLYHSDGCNTTETVFHWCYVNDLHTTHAVVCWVTAPTLTPIIPRSLSLMDCVDTSDDKDKISEMEISMSSLHGRPKLALIFS